MKGKRRLETDIGGPINTLRQFKKIGTSALIFFGQDVETTLDMHKLPLGNSPLNNSITAIRTPLA